MKMKAVENKVTTLIAEDLSVMGYELVRVQAMAGGEYVTLQIMAERLDSKAMTVDDCVRISHAISARLDGDSTMDDRYTLEVSSPGIDRPLVRLKDYIRFQGHVARIELQAPLLGKKRFQGSIVRIKGDDDEAEIEFRTDSGDVAVKLASIAKAKLVLTDALLDAKDGMKH